MSDKNTQTKLDAATMDEKETEVVVQVSAEENAAGSMSEVVSDGTKNNEPKIENEVRYESEQNTSKKKRDDTKRALKVLFSKTSEEDKKVSDKEKMEALMGVAMATEELRQLKKEYGIEDEPKRKGGKISRTVSSWFERNENQEPIPVNKKKYIWIALLTGWFGGHRFYVKHYRVGLIYLLLFWAGIGLYHTMVDIMIVIPMKPDENGNIML